MIHRLSIKDPTKTPVKWLAQVAAFKKPRTFVFTPGLNVLWGRNGAGKTSLTKLLARVFHCEQSGAPVVTEESLRILAGDSFNNELDVEAGLELEHDGQGVRHFDPGHAAGLIRNGAAFDWDFGGEGIQNLMFRGSAGQTTMFRSDQLTQEIVAAVVPEVAWKLRRAGLNDLWAARFDLATKLLKKNGKKGPSTVLLDEPERSYDLNMQSGMWRMMRAYADEVQFIVASHSLFALGIPEANYIELSPGYLQQSLAVVETLRTWGEDQPRKIPDRERSDLRRALLSKKKPAR